jgi:hypothetical protein
MLYLENKRKRTAFLRPIPHCQAQPTILVKDIQRKWSYSWKGQDSPEICNTRSQMVVGFFLEVFKRGIYFNGTGVWTQVFMLAKQCSTAWATPPVHFALVILEIKVFRIFAQTGLKPQSSQSQPPKYLGLQVWATSTWVAHKADKDHVLLLLSAILTWSFRKQTLSVPFKTSFQLSSTLEEMILLCLKDLTQF